MANLNHFGVCPCCLTKFDIKTATPIFNQPLPKTRISFLYGLCQSCTPLFLKSSYQNKMRMGKKSTEQILKNMREDWAVVDSFSLQVRNGNFYDAWWFGHGLPSYIFEGVYDGSIDGIVIFPSIAEVHHE
jgi:hypothetical protein